MNKFLAFLIFWSFSSAYADQINYNPTILAWGGTCQETIDLFTINKFEIDQVDKGLKITGTGLGNITTIALYPSDSVSTPSNQMLIVSKTYGEIIAIPQSSNIILTNGSILKIK